MTNYELANILLQAVVSIAAFASLAFLYIQIRSMNAQVIVAQEATRAQCALAIISFLQDSEARASRQRVRSSLHNKPHSLWSEEECRHASAVCANYDVAAALLRAGLADPSLIVENWGPSILHCHEILSPYMREVRSRAGGHPNYWTNFDWLKDQFSSSSVK